MARYLVVDDDASTVRAMTRLLIGDGHSVTPFTSGQEAVDALARQSFDAVLTDLDMPGADGRTVARAARQWAPHACVVVATARAEQNCQDLVDAGACIVADKPFEYDEVTREISHCRARGGRDGAGRCHMRARPQGHQLIPLRRR